MKVTQSHLSQIKLSFIGYNVSNCCRFLMNILGVIQGENCQTFWKPCIYACIHVSQCICPLQCDLISRQKKTSKAPVLNCSCNRPVTTGIPPETCSSTGFSKGVRNLIFTVINSMFKCYMYLQLLTNRSTTLELCSQKF